MERTDGRLSLAVLVAGAALVLTAGAAWWVSAAPEIAAQPFETPPPAAVPEVVAPEPVYSDLDSFLPEFDTVLQREVVTIEPEQTHLMTLVVEKDNPYLVQYVCVGEGELLVRIRGTTEGELLQHADCGGNITAYQFMAANPTVVVEVTRPGREPAGVGMQIVDVD